MWSSPAIGSDGTVYVGSNDNKVYAMNGKTGAKLWEFATGGMVWSSPAIGSDGTVYIGSLDNNVYALNGSTGEKKWEFLTRDWVSFDPVIGMYDTLYVGSWDKNLYALNGETGTKKWEYLMPGAGTNSAAIGSDGTVYVGTSSSLYGQLYKGDGKVYALDGATGAKKWDSETGFDGSSVGKPVIGSDGTLYLANDGLNAIRTDSQGPADSPWPMFGQNAQRTGVTPEFIQPPWQATNAIEETIAWDGSIHFYRITIPPNTTFANLRISQVEGSNTHLVSYKMGYSPDSETMVLTNNLMIGYYPDQLIYPSSAWLWSSRFFPQGVLGRELFLKVGWLGRDPDLNDNDSTLMTYKVELQLELDGQPADSSVKYIQSIGYPIEDKVTETNASEGTNDVENPPSNGSEDTSGPSRIKDALGVGNGWRQSDWLGYFWEGKDTNWVFHELIGWLYVAKDAEADSYWLYSPKLGWLWLDGESYPYLYHAKLGWIYVMRDAKPATFWLSTPKLGWLRTEISYYPYFKPMKSEDWLMFLADSNATLWFYDYRTEQWEAPMLEDQAPATLNTVSSYLETNGTYDLSDLAGFMNGEGTDYNLSITTSDSSNTTEETVSDVGPIVLDYSNGLLSVSTKVHSFSMEVSRYWDPAQGFNHHKTKDAPLSIDWRTYRYDTYSQTLSYSGRSVRELSGKSTISDSFEFSRNYNESAGSDWGDASFNSSVSNTTKVSLELSPSKAILGIGLSYRSSRSQSNLFPAPGAGNHWVVITFSATLPGL